MTRPPPRHSIRAWSSPRSTSWPSWPPAVGPSSSGAGRGGSRCRSRRAALKFTGSSCRGPGADVAPPPDRPRPARSAIPAGSVRLARRARPDGATGRPGAPGALGGLEAGTVHERDPRARVSVGQSGGEEVMKAAVYDHYGPPEVVRVEDVARPVPGDGDVLVRVQAASVNRADLDGLAPRPQFVRLFMGVRAPRNPRIGFDVAGVVEEVGSGVTRFKPGDQVFTDLFT